MLQIYRLRRNLREIFVFLLLQAFVGALSAQGNPSRDKAIEVTQKVLFDYRRDYLRMKQNEFEARYDIGIRFRVDDQSINQIGGLSEYLFKIFQSITLPENSLSKTITGEYSFAQNGKITDTISYKTNCTQDILNCLIPPSTCETIDNQINSSLAGIGIKKDSKLTDLDTMDVVSARVINKYAYSIYTNTTCPDLKDPYAALQQQSIANTASERKAHWLSSISALSDELYLTHENLIGQGLQHLSFNPTAAAINVNVIPNDPPARQFIDLNGCVNNCLRRDLEARARLLYAKTNIRFFFVTQTLDFFIPPDSCAKFIDDVTQKLFTTNNDKNLIVALWLQCCDAKSGLKSGCLLVQQNGKWLETEEIDFAANGNRGNYNKAALYKFNALMRSIPKPLIVCYQVAKVCGSISTAYFYKSEKIKGFEQVYLHVFKQDKSIASLNEQLHTYNAMKIASGIAGFAMTDEQKTRLAIIKATKARALLKPDLENVGIQFKEHYLQDSAIAQKAAETVLESKYSAIFKDKAISFAEAQVNMPVDVKVGTCEEQVLLDDVEQYLMLSSAALSFVGLDFIPDALSVVFYVGIGNYEAAVYSAISLDLAFNLNYPRIFFKTTEDIISGLNEGALLTIGSDHGIVAVRQELPVFAEVYNLPPKELGSELVAKICSKTEITQSLLLLEDAEARLIRRLNDVEPEKRRELLNEFYDNEALRKACIKDADEVVRWTLKLSDDELKLLKYGDFRASITAVEKLISEKKLNFSTGSASIVELAAIHRYTINGGILNGPMRAGSEIGVGAVGFNAYERLVYQHVVSGLEKLRATNRLVQNTVVRGRTYSAADFTALFGKADAEVPLKGFVSCTTDEKVAIDFLTKTSSSIQGPKVKVIMKIKSKNGVYIDDLSDWGENLVKDNHPGEMPQLEALLEEGFYKMKGEAKFVKEIDEVPWYEIEMEEHGNPIRKL